MKTGRSWRPWRRIFGPPPDQEVDEELKFTSSSGRAIIRVFGRLARGFSEKAAQSELVTGGDQMAAAFPQSYVNTRPQVLSYTHAFVGVKGLG